MTSGSAISSRVKAEEGDTEPCGPASTPMQDNAPLDGEPSVAADPHDDDTDFAADDRRASFELPVPLIGRVGRLAPFAAVALALHLVIFAALALFARAVEPIPAQSETTVEIVQEVPKAEAEKKTDFAKLDEMRIAKPEPPKVDPLKEETPKVETPKIDPPKADKAEPPKADAAKAEAPKADPPKQEPPKQASSSEADPETAKALETMRSELAALQAQKETLQHEAAVEESQAAREEAAQAKAAQDQASRSARAKAAADAKAAVETKALGLDLPDAFMAVAMPGQSVDGEIGASYQSLVFSLLAKARKTVKQVVRPGVAGVAFTIDDAGKLASVTLDHPSGDKGLDDEALAIVRRAAPFPRPLPGGQRTFSAAMRFYIDD